MKKIVIIGGGDAGKLETLSIDKRILDLSGKSNPKALFIPTASGDSQDYIDTFHKAYKKKLGCEVQVLFLLKEKPTLKQLRDRIFNSDIIYVGGGNTLMMMKRWRFLGVDTLLKEAYKSGIVVAGKSAGGICWFESGHSDSLSYYNSKKWDYINVGGMGVLKGIHCPHYNSGTLLGKKMHYRKTDFSHFMQKHSSMGIAIDNHCAIEFLDDQYKVLNSKISSKAFSVYREAGKVKVREIEKKKSHAGISEIYLK